MIIGTRCDVGADCAGLGGDGGGGAFASCVCVGVDGDEDVDDSSVFAAAGFIDAGSTPSTGFGDNAYKAPPTSTSWSISAKYFAIYPSFGALISTETLSVSISITISSVATFSPICLWICVTVPSVIESPRFGTTIDSISPLKYRFVSTLILNEYQHQPLFLINIYI